MRSWCTARRLGVAALLAGVVALVLAAWLIYPPAGVATLGVSLLFAGYSTLYVEARRNAVDRQPDAVGASD